MTPADAAAAGALFEAGRQEGGGGGWTAAAVAEALDAGGFGACARSATGPSTNTAMGDSDGALLGAALATPAGDDAELVDIVVAADARRAGLGRALLTAVVDAAAAAGFRRLILEVAQDNAPARALYMAEGFGTIGRRPGYYRRGLMSIDAEVMARALP